MTKPHRAAAIVLLATCYYAGARLGLRLGALPGNVAPVWPPTGLSIAALVLVGPRLAPGVFLGALAANLFSPVPAAAAFGMAVGNTLEALAAAWAFQRVVGPRAVLTRTVDVLGFAVFCAGAATMVSASFGVGSLVATGVVPASSWYGVWRVWWIGDALGALTVGAAILVWSRRRDWPRVRIPEFAGLLLGVGAASWLVFSTPLPRLYLLFPFVIWAALRFSAHGVTATTLTVAGVAIARTAAGMGPFAGGTTTHGLWALDLYLAVIGLTGLVLAAVVAERDEASASVTELRRSQELLRAAEEQFRLSFEGAPIGIALVSLEGRFLRVNQALCDIVGFAEADLLTTTFQDITHPDDLEADLRFFAQLLSAERSNYQMDKRYIDARGQIVWVQLNVSSVCDETGHPSHVIAQIQDITKRRATEAQLRESESRFRRLAAGAPIGIFQTDACGRVVYANDTWGTTCAWDAEAIRGTAWTAAVSFLDREQVEREWRRARKASRPLAVQFRVADPGSDSPRWIDVRLQPMPLDDAGASATWVGTATDVTALVQAHDAITDARDRALRASEMKSQFLANMSHEIRTPMNGVVGMAELLADSPLSPAQQDHVAALRAAATSLLGLLNDILDLARIEAGKVTLEETEFSVATVVKQTALLFAAAAETKGIELADELDDDADTWVRGDATRLRQVLSNLVGNAVKFTDRGGVRIHVAREDQQVRFEVHDTGIGIPEDIHSRLMTPFEQGDPSTTRRYGGSGLGLAICQELVTIMGGTISFDRNGDAGTTVVARLPLPVVNAPDLVSEQSPPRRPAAPVAAGRVLLAEDNVINQRVARAMLERLGYEVVVVDNGQAAVDEAAVHDYDAVILDCQMPVLDGYGAAEAIRRLPSRSGRVRIIAMTASAYDEDRDRCLAAGMNDYLSKPVTRQQLADALDRTVALPA